MIGWCIDHQPCEIFEFGAWMKMEDGIHPFRFLMANADEPQSWPYTAFSEKPIWCSFRSPLKSPAVIFLLCRGIVNSWFTTSSATLSSWGPMNAAWNPSLRAADPQGDSHTSWNQLELSIEFHTIGRWTLGFVAISIRILYVYSLVAFWSCLISLVVVSKR